MRLKSDKEFDDAVKASNIKKDRKDVLAAQVRSARPERLDELFEIWGTEDGGLAKNELAFAKSLVEGDTNGAAAASTATTATPTAPLIGA